MPLRPVKVSVPDFFCEPTTGATCALMVDMDRVSRDFPSLCPSDESIHWERRGDHLFQIGLGFGMRIGIPFGFPLDFARLRRNRAGPPVSLRSCVGMTKFLLRLLSISSQNGWRSNRFCDELLSVRLHSASNRRYRGDEPPRGEPSPDH